jgi:hypothetical protein
MGEPFTGRGRVESMKQSESSVVRAQFHEGRGGHRGRLAQLGRSATTVRPPLLLCHTLFLGIRVSSAPAGFLKVAQLLQSRKKRGGINHRFFQTSGPDPS